MSRQSIFDIVNRIKYPSEEIERIEILLNKEGGAYYSEDIFNFDKKGKAMSIIKYIDEFLFISWSQRGNCISTKDFKKSAGIEKRDNIDEDYVLRYCEYAANMVSLIQNRIAPGDSLGVEANAISRNVESLLNWFDYETKILSEQEKVIVVKKSAQTTAVAEILPLDISYLILEYNHFLLQGNIPRKKEILFTLGGDLEPKQPELELLDKNLKKYIFGMLNNLDIRHNNRKKGDKNYKEYVAKMKKSMLEKWYDELYQMILLAYLLLDNTERITKVKDLMSKINAQGGN